MRNTSLGCTKIPFKGDAGLNSTALENQVLTGTFSEVAGLVSVRESYDVLAPIGNRT